MKKAVFIPWPRMHSFHSKDAPFSLFYERGLSFFFAKLLDNELLKLHYFLRVAKRETGSLHIHMFEVKPAYGPKALFFIKFFNRATVSKSCNCTKLSWLRIDKTTHVFGTHLSLHFEEVKSRLFPLKMARRTILPTQRSTICWWALDVVRCEQQ